MNELIYEKEVMHSIDKKTSDGGIAALTSFSKSVKVGIRRLIFRGACATVVR
jgi:hypothetical protein